MNIRKPVVAGRFYPADSVQANRELDMYLHTDFSSKDLPKEIFGGLVPHAGWVCSGSTAGKTFQAIKTVTDDVDVFVLFGAVHQYGVNKPAIFPKGIWQSPLGEIEIDEELAEEILAVSNVIESAPQAHTYEHSLEVQIPFIKKLFASAKIVPIMTPPTEDALIAGKNVAKAIEQANTKSEKKIVCVGSTDLTHYGPSYSFTPKGIGVDGIAWAKQVNDAGLLEHILNLDARSALKYALETHSACGAGAIAATISAVISLGADKAMLLEHTTSYEVLGKAYGEFSQDSVGYASVIFGK